MSDYKDSFSSCVISSKAEAAEEGMEELYDNIQKGKSRAQQYGENWETVDINDVVERIAPGSEPVRERGKIYFYNKEHTMAVVADIGGGYLRILDLNQNTRHKQYLDQYGNDAHNYIDEHGRTHGRSKAEYNRCTHYKIKKKGD